MRLKTEEISAVRDALRRSHRELATFAGTIPPAERTCRSHCTEWTIAQVYSHLGSGAEIGLANLQARLTGAAPAGPTHRRRTCGPVDDLAAMGLADSRCDGQWTCGGGQQVS